MKKQFFFKIKQTGAQRQSACLTRAMAQCLRTFNQLMPKSGVEHGTGHLKRLFPSRVVKLVGPCSRRSGTLPAAASVGGGGRGVS